ncbi:MAG: hypothetical protein PHN72_06260 [Bacilli bacterium]|nr:hypothetical protein [Bacilli bacterium]
MKSKYSNQIKIINYITSTDRFKFLFLLAILFAAYAAFVLGISTDNFLDAIFIPFQFNIFNILFFALIFFNNLNTCSTFETKFDYYIIRLENKKNFIKEIMKNSILMNLFYLLIFFLFYFMFLSLIKFGNFEIHNYSNYSINNFIYVIYYLIRYFLITILLNVITTYLYLNFKMIATIGFNVLFLIGFMMVPISADPINNISLIIWFFLSPIVFSNFSLDVTSFITFLIIVEIIIIIIHKITLKNKNVVIT